MIRTDRMVSPVRSGLVIAVAGVVFAAGAIVVVRYIAADPFEYDIKKLRSEGADADRRARTGCSVSDTNFGRGICGPDVHRRRSASSRCR